MTRKITSKFDVLGKAPALTDAWMALSWEVNAGLEKPLLELVKIRASQINGCANCLNMHTAEAREGRDRAASAAAAWHEAPCYSDRERAALAWTEALTEIAEGRPTMPSMKRSTRSSARRSR